MNKLEIMNQVLEILESSCEDPAQELQKNGQALIDIGKALEGQSLSDARAIMRGAAELLNISSSGR